MSCHRCLQLVCDVLCELTFQNVLLLACGLQTLIYLDDLLCNLTQLVVGEGDEVFRVERLAVVGPCCKRAQLRDVVAQTVCEAIENDDEHQHGREREPDVVLVGFERFGQVVVIRQGAAYDEAVGVEPCGGVEEIVVQRGAVTLHR